MNAISGALFLLAFVPYIWAILQGETVPSPVSWAIWACIDTLVLAAMHKEKAAYGQMIGATAGAWIITFLAFVFGRSSMGAVEWVSIAMALAGIAMWKKTGNAVFAIVCAQIAVFAGAIPTFVGAYQSPSQENWIAWSGWFLSCLFALGAVKKWDLANALQPINFTLMETIMVTLVVVRPYFLT